MKPVDLRSDTVTRPTPGMRRAIAAAEVGDDVFGDDALTNRLEAVVAERAGKEAALFVPSGTMANQIALRLHCRPGDEALMEAHAHPFNYEAGGAAMIAGAQIRPIPGERGLLDVGQVAAHFRPENVHFSPVAVLCVEDTANRGGGSVYPLGRLDALGALAHEKGAAAHLDGARLWNAAVASGVPVARRAAAFDTVSLCLSKGLGAPVGSLLCGPKALIGVGRRIRKALGGGMRQTGLLAAAGLYALDHHVDRLAEDHVRAQRLAEGLVSLGFGVVPPETNMVYVTVGDANAAVAQLAAAAVACNAVAADCLRLVTHLDIDDAAVDQALSAFSALPR